MDKEPLAMDKQRSRGALLFISVLMHGLLALLPWQEKSRPLAVSSPPTKPISIVDASQLPTLPASEPQPALSSPPAAVPDLPQIPEDPVPDVPIDDPGPIPEAALTPGAPIPEASDGSIGEPAPDRVPDTAPSANPNPVTSAEEDARIAAEWEQLVGYLGDQDEGFGFKLSEVFQNFGTSIQINQFNQFFKDEDGNSEIQVFGFSHFPSRTPDQVLQTVVMPELENNTGFDRQSEESFSAGQAYQLLQGRYLIIVKLRDGEGSVLILSESLPGLES